MLKAQSLQLVSIFIIDSKSNAHLSQNNWSRRFCTKHINLNQFLKSSLYFISEIQGYITRVDIFNTTNDSSTNDGNADFKPTTNEELTKEDSISDKSSTSMQNARPGALRYVLR